MAMNVPGVDAFGKPEYPLPETQVRGAHPQVRPLSGDGRLPFDETEIQEAMDTLGKSFRLFNHRLQFTMNREINRIVVKVIDRETDKVIKEIPPEEIQRMAAKMREMIGLLVDEKI